MIIIRYLMREVTKAQIAILLILLLIFFSQSMIRILGAAVEGSISSDLILPVLMLGVPDMAQLILPLSLFLALLMTLSKLYTESEITVMFACGMSPKRILFTAALLSVFTCTLAALNVAYLLPWSAQHKVELVEDAKANPSLAALVEGQFQRTPDGAAVLYVGEIKGKTFSNVFLAQMHQVDDRKPSIVVAQQGTILQHPNGIQEVVLSDGARYEGTAATKEFRITDFERYQAFIGKKAMSSSVVSDQVAIDELSFVQLLESDNPEAKAEIHWRLSLIISVILMAMIVVPLSEVNPRQGRVISMLPAILLYLIYFLIQSTLRSNASKGNIDPLFWVWGVNLGYLLIGLILNSWQSIWMRRLRAVFASKTLFESKAGAIK